MAKSRCNRLPPPPPSSAPTFHPTLAVARITTRTVTITVSTTNPQSQKGASHPTCAAAGAADAGWLGDERARVATVPRSTMVAGRGPKPAGLPHQSRRDSVIGVSKGGVGSTAWGPEPAVFATLGGDFETGRRGGRFDQGRHGLGLEWLSRVIRLRRRLSPLRRGALAFSDAGVVVPRIRLQRLRDLHRRGVPLVGRLSHHPLDDLGSALREDRVPSGTAVSARSPGARTASRAGWGREMEPGQYTYGISYILANRCRCGYRRRASAAPARERHSRTCRPWPHRA